MWGLTIPSRAGRSDGQILAARGTRFIVVGSCSPGFAPLDFTLHLLADSGRHGRATNYALQFGEGLGGYYCICAQLIVAACVFAALLFDAIGVLKESHLRNLQLWTRAKRGHQLGHSHFLS
jgi:hypothetical protein